MSSRKARKLNIESTPASASYRRSTRYSEEEELPGLFVKRNPKIAVLNDIEPSNSNAQLQSPLFGVLSPELRNIIFELVLQPTVQQGTEEEVIDYLKDRYRLVVPPILGPDASKEHACRVAQKEDKVETRTFFTISLLRTCRMIFGETRFLPILNARQQLFASMPSGPKSIMRLRASRHSKLVLPTQ
jgi:hypothetical protein